MLGVLRAHGIHLPASVRIICAPRLATCARASTACTHWSCRRWSLDAFAGQSYWDHGGFAVWAKRIEEGAYAMLFDESEQKRREITAAELGALLSGIDLSRAKRRKRYCLRSAEATQTGTQTESRRRFDPAQLPDNTEVLRRMVLDLIGRTESIAPLARRPVFNTTANCASFLKSKLLRSSFELHLQRPSLSIHICGASLAWQVSSGPSRDRHKRGFFASEYSESERPVIYYAPRLIQPGQNHKAIKIRNKSGIIITTGPKPIFYYFPR